MAKKKNEEKTEQVKPKLHVSRVRKALKRTLKTADFEGVVIEESIDEEVEWETLSERKKKLSNWNKILLDQFKETHDYALHELGPLCEHKAYKKKTGKTVATSPQSKEVLMKQEEDEKRPPRIIDGASIDFDQLEEIG